MINNVILPTLVFPITDDGSLMDPIAGDYFEESGTLENIHSIKLISTLSIKSNCLLEVKYNLSSTEKYSYSLSSKTTYPEHGQDNYNELCNIHKDNKAYTVADELENWITSIMKFMKLRKPRHGVVVSNIIELAWQLRPDVEQLDIFKSTKLISDIDICIKTKSMRAKILGSQPLNIQFTTGHIKLDTHFKLNGFNDIKIAFEHNQFVPKDHSLGWVPTRIVGKFDHGDLNGFTYIETNVSNVIWAMVRHGILHGPCVISAISYVIEQVSSLL